MGLVDSYFSIAKLYKTNKDSKSYSLSNYINSNKPFINVDNIWHPYLDSHSVVKNNITLGNSNKQNIIISKLLLLSSGLL